MRLVRDLIMQPAAVQVGFPVGAPTPFAVTGRFFRFLACSPFQVIGAVDGGLPLIQTPLFPPGSVRQHPLYIRRGRFPLRVLVGTRPMVIAGSDWHEFDGESKRTEITLISNAEADAAMAMVAGGLAGGGYGPLAPGSAYSYILETSDGPPGDVQQPSSPDLCAQGSFQTNVSLRTGAWSLLDYNLPRCFDRHKVVIQNNGPNPILIATCGDWDLIGVANFVPNGPGGLILAGAPGLGQPGGSWEVEVGWGTSFFGLSTVANQTALGGATMVTEL